MLNLFKQKNKENKALKRTSLSSGFTLVETLIAISIFTVAIVGLMSVLASGISDTNYAKKKLIAQYLNQEGIEYIRNMRDSYVLYDGTSAQNGWNLFKDKLLVTGSCAQPNNKGCYFNDSTLDYNNPNQPITNLTIIGCDATCPKLSYDKNLKKYYMQYDPDTGYSFNATVIDSGFIRKIQATQISPDEIKVSSTVYWSQGSGSFSVSFSENLFNWVQ